MPDYQNAKIYKLVNDTLGLTYYGSTTKQLCVRKAQHKSGAKRKDMASSNILFQGEGKVEIVLIEKFPCNDKEELNKRERFYVKNNECVNKQIPGQTKKEWYENNPNYYKDYREKNRVKLRENAKIAIEKRKDEYDAYQKKWREDNKDRLNEKINCECGSTFIGRGISRHLKTKKHKNFILDSL